MDIIDLFSDCGGMSLGFEMAGFRTRRALERDAWASETYRMNHRCAEVFSGDIRDVADPGSLLGPVSPRGIIGGPPFNRKRLTPPKVAGMPVSIRQALSDLPELGAGEGEEEAEYPSEPLNAYQAWCRERKGKVWNHVAMRHSPRIVGRFKTIGFGQSLADVPAEHM